MDEDQKEEAKKDWQELKDRKVHPLAAVAFAIIFITATFGSTRLLREHFQWPGNFLPAAGLLAVKDFVLVTLIVSVFEILLKNKRHPIRYGFTFGTIYFFVTFIFWAFFS